MPIVLGEARERRVVIDFFSAGKEIETQRGKKNTEFSKNQFYDVLTCNFSFFPFPILFLFF